MFGKNSSKKKEARTKKYIVEVFQYTSYRKKEGRKVEDRDGQILSFDSVFIG